MFARVIESENREFVNIIALKKKASNKYLIE